MSDIKELPSITEPSLNLESMYNTLLEMKQALEILAGSHGFERGAVTQKVHKQSINKLFTLLTDAVSLKTRTFYQPEPPTAENEGDLWVDTDDNNKLYRWNGAEWEVASADGMTVFRQNDEPTTTVIGALWVDTDDNNRLYRWSGTIWEEVTDTRIASTASAVNALDSRVTVNESEIAGQASAISSLETRVSTNETDIDSQSTAITSLETNIDLRARTFIQTTAPTADNPGDIWIDSDDNNKPYRWDGSAWIVIQDTSRNKTFVQTSPPTATAVGDLWFDSDAGYKLYRWNGTSWEAVDDARIAANASAITTLDSRVTSVEGTVTSQASAITALNATVAVRNRTFIQTTAPTASNAGDLWIDSDDDNHPYRWSGSAWVSIKGSADNGATTFVQDSAPTANAPGDLWFDSDDNYKMYRWNGTVWLLVSDGRIDGNASAISSLDSRVTATESSITSQATSVTDLETSVNQRNRTFYTGSPPTADNIGDLWIDSDDGNKLYRWNGSAWQMVGSSTDNGATTYVATDPPTANAPGDLWFDSDDGFKLYRWDGASWIAVADTRISGNASAISTLDSRVDANDADIIAQASDITALTARMDDAEDNISASASAVSSLTTTVSNRNRTFIQTSAPTADNTGDLWIDSDDGNKPYRWSGSAWVSIQDGNKNKTFVQTSAPTATATGDLWFDSDDANKLYRWNGSSWVAVDDGRINSIATSVTALTTRVDDAENDISGNSSAISSLGSRVTAAEGNITSQASSITSLNSTVSQRNRTFIQTTAPTASNAGDLWIDSDDDNKPYRWSGSAWVAIQDTSRNKTFIQTSAPTATATGDLWFDSDDNNKMYRWNGSSWVAIDDARIAAAASAISSLNTTVTLRNRTFIQTTAPTADNTGDLWVDSDDGNKLYRWSGSAWVSVQDSAYTAKNKTFVQGTAPTATSVGDLWFDSANGNKQYRWSGSAWDAVDDSRIAAAATAITSLNSTINLRNRTFIQTTAPTASNTGDLWVDSDDDNKLYRWSGSAWVAIQDTSRNKTFVQTSAPTATAVGDLWFDSDDNNKLYRWSGSAWVAVADARIDANATAISTLGTRVTTAEGAITSGASQVTALSASLDAVNVREGGFNPVLAWRGYTDLSAWSLSNATLADNGSGDARLSSTGSDPQFYKGGLSINGAANRYVAIKYKVITPSAAEGRFYYSTAGAGHSYNGSWRQDFTLPATGKVGYLLLDMHALTAGGTDWKASTITGIRIDFYSTTGSVVDVLWVAVGNDRPGPSFEAVSANASAISSLNATVSNRNRTFIQTSAPTADNAGDLWVDSDDGNKTYRWSGSAWVSIQDDNKNKTFVQSSAPTAIAVGDLWFDSANGNKQYRWSGASWVAVDDSRISAAASAITALNSTIGNRNRTFYQTSAPTADNTGDLWVDSDDNNKPYRWNGSAWVAIQDTSRNKTFVQTSAPSATAVGDLWFDSDDNNKMYRWDGSTWQAVDDSRISGTASALSSLTTRVDSAENNISSAAAAITSLNSTINVRNRTFVQGTAPTASNAGDLWVDSAGGNKLYRWDGSSWVSMQDTAYTAKNQTFTQISAPTATATGDLWFDTDDNNKMYRWNGTSWVAVDDARITANASAISSLNTTVTQRNRTFVQGTAPTASNAGDLWIDTANGNRLNRWSGSAWTNVQDTAYTAKNKTFAQTSAPTATSTGDLWVDTDDNNKLYRWNGTSWVAVDDSRIASTASALTALDTRVGTAESAISGQSSSITSLTSRVTAAENSISSQGSSITTLNTTINQRNRTFIQTTAPAASNTGDIWIDSDDDNKPYRWSGSAWVSIQDTSRNKTFIQTSAPTATTTGDLWFDSDDNNKLYRWNGTSWVAVDDSRLTANSSAISALDSRVTAAEGTIASQASSITALNSTVALRNRTFAQTTAPTASNAGDLWIDTDDDNKLYRWSGSAWVSMQGTADNGATTYVQTTAPTANAVGDLWFDSDDAYKEYRWNGTSWVLVADTRISANASAISSLDTRVTSAEGSISTQSSAITSLNNTVTLRNRTFVQGTAPTASNAGDLWVDSANSNKLYRWSGSAWVSVQDTAYTTKNQTFAQTSAPTAVAAGDLWIDIDDDNKLYRWNGTSWVALDDGRLAANASAISTLNTTINQRNRTFVQGTAPTASNAGDLWVDSANGNKLYRWSGSAWVSVQDTAYTTKNQSFVQASPPTAIAAGDLWFDSDDNNKQYRWSGSAWVAVDDARIASAASAITTLNSDVDAIQVREGGFNAIQAFRGYADMSSWTVTGNTIADNGSGAARLTGTATNPVFSKGGLSINGATYRYVAIKFKVITAATAEGHLYYSTAGHTFSSSFAKNFSVPAAGETAYLILDMFALDVGGTDWKTNTITGLRFDFYSNAGGVVDIIWIGVGNDAPGPAFETVNSQASAISALDTRVTTAEGNITTQASSITALNTAINLRNRTFIQTTAPTATNAGDLWVDSDDDNHLYRWDGSSWVSIQSSVTGARTFVQTSAPTANAAGDLWFDSDDNNKMYRWNGTSWVAIDDSRIAAATSAVSSLTTRMSTAESNISSQASSITSLNTNIALRNRTFVQGTAPTASNAGDLWADSSNNNKLYRWSGSAWVSIQDTAYTGKSQTFAQTSAPTANAVGDLWIDTDDNNKLYRWSGSAWVALDDSRIAANASAISTLNTTINQRNRTFIQTTAPTASNTGDLWVDSDDDNKLYRWSGSAWVVIQDTSRNKTFAQTSAPTATASGDIWFDTDDNNKQYRWNGSAWIAVDDARIASAASAITAIQSSLADTQRTLGTFNPKIAWRNYADLSTWTLNNMTGAEQDGGIRLTSTTPDPKFIKESIAINGATARYIAMKVRVVTPVTVDGTVFYKTAGHGYDGNYFKKFTIPANAGEYAYGLLDMYSLDAGGTDWKSNTITGIRIDFYGATGGVLDVFYVAVGNDQPGASTDDIAANSSAISALDTRVTSAEGSISSQASSITALQSTVSQRNRTFAQTSAPTASNTGDLWIDTDDNNKLYRWNGSSWTSVQSTATGAVTFAQPTAPTANAAGDLWFDTDDNNKQYRWSGSAWVAVDDARIAGNASAITTLNTDVSGLDADITALSDAFTNVIADNGNGDAQGMFRVSAQAAPSGSAATIALEAKAEASGSFPAAAALFIDAKSDGTSRVRINADKFEVITATGSKKLIDVSGDNISLNSNVAISGNLVVGGTITADKLTANSITGTRVGTNSFTLNKSPNFSQSITFTNVVIDSTVVGIVLLVHINGHINSDNNGNGVCRFAVRWRMGNVEILQDTRNFQQADVNTDTSFSFTIVKPRTIVSNGTYTATIDFLWNNTGGGTGSIAATADVALQVLRA